MYFISNYFKQLIDNAGGPISFSNLHKLSERTITEWYNRTRRAQENSLLAVAALIGIGVNNWQLLK